MTKKAELILKKATLFEKLALKGNNRDFLKRLAQTVDPRDWKPEFQQLLAYTRSAVEQIPPNLMESNEANIVRQLVQKDNPTIEDIGNAIPYMKRLVPWMKGPNNLEATYARVKADWQLPEVQQTMPAGSTATPAQTKMPQTDNSLFNFYYSKLVSATNTPNLMDLFAYIPKMESLLRKMDQGASSVETKALIGKGRQALTAARLKAGIGESDYMPPEEMPETNVAELGDWGVA